MIQRATCGNPFCTAALVPKHQIYCLASAININKLTLNHLTSTWTENEEFVRFLAKNISERTLKNQYSSLSQYYNNIAGFGQIPPVLSDEHVNYRDFLPWHSDFQKRGIRPDSVFVLEMSPFRWTNSASQNRKICIVLLPILLLHHAGPKKSWETEKIRGRCNEDLDESSSDDNRSGYLDLNFLKSIHTRSFPHLRTPN